MNLSDITLVVPTRNEAHNIPRFLASIPPSLRLIVVDASTDATPEIVVRLRPKTAHVIRCAGTIPEARQLGAEAARTDWLLFTDADVLFPKSYFRRLAKYLDADCVYGSKLSLNRFRRYYRYFSYGQQVCHRFGIPAASGSNLALRRHTLVGVGGFDPELVCNEDSELVWRIKRAGFRVRFAPDLPVYATDHRRLERGLARKTLHSVFRCLLLYTDLLPSHWRGADWGYWSHVRQEDETGTRS